MDESVETGIIPDLPGCDSPFPVIRFRSATKIREVWLKLTEPGSSFQFSLFMCPRFKNVVAFSCNVRSPVSATENNPLHFTYILILQVDARCKCRHVSKVCFPSLSSAQPGFSASQKPVKCSLFPVDGTIYVPRAAGCASIASRLTTSDRTLFKPPQCTPRLGNH